MVTSHSDYKLVIYDIWPNENTNLVRVRTKSYRRNYRRKIFQTLTGGFYFPLEFFHIMEVRVWERVLIMPRLAAAHLSVLRFGKFSRNSVPWTLLGGLQRPPKFPAATSLAWLGRRFFRSKSGQTHSALQKFFPVVFLMSMNFILSFFEFFFISEKNFKIADFS